MLMMLAILEGISVGLLVPVVIWAVRQVKTHKKCHDELEESQVRQEQFNMLQLHYRAKASGITMHEKTLFYSMYDAYKSKGYNSFIDDIKQEVDKI